MLQTILYIPNEIGGWPLFGFGILLAVWAVGSVCLLARLVRHQGFNADTKSYLPVLGILGAAIAVVLPALCDARGLPIRGYGAMILLAVVSGLLLAAYRAKRIGVDPEMIFALAFWMILPGIFGARAVYVTEYWNDQFWPAYASPGGSLGALLGAIINVAAGGLVVYGAFFGGVIGMGLFWWRHRMPLLATADLAAPSMLLGLALGRVGCLLNGCCYGGPCDLPWKITFPWNSPVHNHQVMKEGSPTVDGLTFRDGPGERVVVDAVQAASPAARAGLAPGAEVAEINGVRLFSAEQARSIVLGIDKLHFVVRREDGQKLYWIVDDPSAADAVAGGSLKIFGMSVADRAGGNCAIERVRFQSPEAAFGLKPGQVIESVSGRRVQGVAQLAELLEEHRGKAWLRIALADRAAPIELTVQRPLPRSQPVHPTQLYSTIDASILCFLLLAYDRFRRRDGELTALMITIYPISRFLVESIRTDEAKNWGPGLSISQSISLGILAAAIALWIYLLRRPAKLAFGG